MLQASFVLQLPKSGERTGAVSTDAIDRFTNIDLALAGIST